ncbi:RNA polymerase sigma factor [Luteolibacter pohnpeiensis]|uniref:RNA polymerase sigma factor n=1 Tax=Luteolibacter pohnpeiensis TaxID=454153 RepID=A0A934SAV5_9BACT|nr:RNA polymerase sigma factor [Luteolibacter pohnpeiensis]MBK1882519.1 RNA polymerase sigma factor [Luteolibacter pohnpeiensis]
MSEFADLVDAYYQALFRFGISLTRDSDRAADLVQETFCIWAEKGDQLRDRSKAKTWLFTTLHREFLSQRRRAAKFSDEELDENATASIAAPEDDAERQMDGQRALDILSSLEETYRAPLALFYLQQHSYKEIAAILDVPIGTVMSRLSRGKEMLRKQMTAEPSSAPKNILQLEPEALKRRG